MKPTKQAEARVWLKENLGKSFRFIENKERKYSVPIQEINEEMNQYRTQTDNYIQSIIKMK